MNCFDKTRRLLKKSQYDYVFSKASKIVNSEFIILYRDNMVGHARLGLALSKKKIAKAHDRNRIKRVLRETFRVNTDLPAVDIIMLARSDVGKVPNGTVKSRLDSTWNKLSNSSAK